MLIRMLEGLSQRIKARRVRIPPPIRTERLELRIFAPADWASVLLYRGDPEVLRYLAATTPIHGRVAHDYVVAQRAIALAIPESSFTLAIVRARDGLLIGEVGLTTAKGQPGHYLGFLLKRSEWGHGYAVEAASALLDHAYGHLGVGAVYAGCHPANRGSRRVLEKLGMRQTASRADFPWSPPGIEALAFETSPEAWRLRTR